MRLTVAGVLFALVGVCSAQQVPKLDIKALVVPAERRLDIDGTAILAPAAVPQEKLYFQLAEQMHDLKMEVAQPAVAAGGVSLAKLSTSGGTTSYAATLPKAIPANTPVTLHFSFTGGDKTAFVFHIGEEASYGSGTNAAWYPEFGPLVDHNGEKACDGASNAVGTVIFKIPAELTVVATGREGQTQKEGAFHSTSFEVTQPCALSFSVAKYEVLRAPGTFPVALYTITPVKDREKMLQGIKDVVALLSKVYGAFPYPEFALVEVTDKSVEGAGFGGAGCAGFMLSTTSFLNEGFNVAFFGHEIGHQWWGNYVTHASEPKGDDLLDEALAQYGSLYCVEHLRGPKEAAAYRWTGYPGYVLSQCGRNYLRMSAASFDCNLEEMNGDGNGLYHELADEKGFLAYDMLRRQIGEKAFHGALQAITKKYANRQLRWDEFKGAVEKSAGKDLRWFWDQWFLRQGAPVLDLKWERTDGGVKGSVYQVAPYYRLDLPLRVTLSDGSSFVNLVHTTEETAPFAFRVGKTVANVELDPEFTVLHYTPESLAEARALADLTRAEWTANTGNAAEGAKLLDAVAAGIQRPDPYGLEFRARFRLAQRSYRAKDYEEAKKQVALSLACPTRDSRLLPYLYQLVMYMAMKDKDDVRTRWGAESAILAEKALGQHTSISSIAEDWVEKHPLKG